MPVKRGADSIKHLNRENLLRKNKVETFQISVFNSGKLKFVSTVNEIYGKENYLKKNNYQNRLAITKLRTSSHNLAIETGWWVNAKRHERMC